MFMDGLLKDVLATVSYFDDALGAALPQEELVCRPHEVLHRFKNAGLRVNREKCK